MGPRSLSHSVPCLTKPRLIFSMAYNGKHMHSQEQREEICGTSETLPSGTQLFFFFLRTTFSGTHIQLFFSLSVLED